MAMTATDALELRLIAPEDAAAVSELSSQLGYQASPEEVRERIEALARHIDTLALVACLHGEVVGWIEAEIARHLQSAPHALITGLVVKDGIRSLGVGKQLCSEVEHWAASNGLSVIRVTSRITREQAHRFYLREGFVQTKTSAVFEKILPNHAE
jgi:GNAT superfamily N-acetyltransferase